MALGVRFVDEDLKFSWCITQRFGLAIGLTWWAGRPELFVLIGPVSFHVERR